MSRLQHLLAKTQPLRIAQFILAIVIFCYAALSPNPQHIIGQHDDGVMHFLGNVLLYLSAWLALWGRWSVLKVAVFLLPFSCAVELAQYFSPGRVVDAKDMAVNVAGLGLGAVMSWCLQWVSHKSLS